MGNSYKIGIVGAGNMGSSVAQQMAVEGLAVTLVDLNDVQVKQGIESITNRLQQAVDRKAITAYKMKDTLNRIKGSTSYEDLEDMDLIIEAIFEDKKLKGELFRMLDGICDPRTILATNTASLNVHELASWTFRPEKVVGMHYFCHPIKNNILEIIPHQGTSEETLKIAAMIGKQHVKTNIIVKDYPGFCVNRMLIPFCTSAVRVLEQKIANIPTIEAACKTAFGIRMGPFELMNRINMPIAAHVSRTLGIEFGSVYASPQLLNIQIETHERFDLSGEVDGTKIRTVMDYMYGVLLGVACQLVDEGVASMEDTDLGAKIGLAWEYGPFEIMNKLGIKKVYEYVNVMSNQFPDFKMPKLLLTHYVTEEPFEFNYAVPEVTENVA